MTIEIDGTTLFYETAGEGRPVLLLHGLGCDHRLMAECMEPVFQLLEGYRRIYVDLPGMGRSEAAAGSGSSDGILSLLLGFIEQVAGHDFLLAGQSYGGYLARGILSRLANRVGGMLLLCPVVVPWGQGRSLPQGTLRFCDNGYLQELAPQEREGFLEYAVVADRAAHQAYQASIAPGLEAANQAFLSTLARHYAFSFDPDKVIRQLNYQKPVLLVTGRQDACTGYRDLWALLEDYPFATFSVLDMAGHNLQIEQPMLFRALAANWLHRVEATR